MLTNNTFAILLLIIILILLGIIIVLLIVSYRFLNQQKGLADNDQPSEFEKKKLALKKQMPEKQIEYFCINHETIEGVGTCAICCDTFCDKCIKDVDKLNFCPEHFRLYNESEWKEVYSVKTTAETPEKGVSLYNLKTETWKKEKTPSFIMTHYKLDLEEDIIESHVKLYVRKVDSASFSEQHLKSL